MAWTKNLQFYIQARVIFLLQQKKKQNKKKKSTNKSIAKTISFSLSARDAETSCDAHLQQNT